MKIAIPTSDGLLDPHFGHCRSFTLFDMEPGSDRVLHCEVVEAPPHEPGLLPKWLSEKGVTRVVAGGMGERAIQIFSQFGVSVEVGAPRVPPEEALKMALSGSLAGGKNVCDH